MSASQVRFDGRTAIWRILHTDYRRPHTTFTATISTVIALHFYKISRE